MSNRKDSDFLRDIQEAIRRIDVYTESMIYDVFLGDLKTQDAVIRNLEIIGEPTKNLSEEIRANYSDVPWRGMAGMRDKLIHHYFGVNFDIVWNVATTELPDIATEIEALTAEIIR